MKKLQTKTPMHKKIQPFSKYDFVKSFITARNKEKQAEVIADTIKNSQETIFDNLVTKDEFRRETLLTRDEFRRETLLMRKEVALAKNELQREVTLIRAELQKDLKTMELRITIKLGVITVSTFGVFSTLILITAKIFFG